VASSVVKAEEEREGLRGLSHLAFIGILVVAAVVIFGLTRLVGNSYAFFAAYVVVQYIVLGTAWNILGGYTGYVNFGITAFFAIGAYSTVVLYKLTPWMPLPVMILVGGVMAALVGLGTG
jgi:branched-chain amino acid transport system permease protein